MNKKLLNELNEMRYLSSYKRGKVISEQDISMDSEKVTSLIEKAKADFKALPKEEKKKLRKIIRECLKERITGVRLLINIGMLTGIIALIVMIAKSADPNITNYLIMAFGVFGIFSLLKVGKEDIGALVNCVKMKKLESNTPKPESSMNLDTDTEDELSDVEIENAMDEIHSMAMNYDSSSENGSMA